MSTAQDVIRVCVVGRGRPETGGIPTYIDTLIAGPMEGRVDFEFCNLAPAAADRATPIGGRVSLGNLGRTLRDAVRVFRAARRADVVHVHSALAPTPTMVRAGVLGGLSRLAGARLVVHAHGGRFIDWSGSTANARLARLALAPAGSIIAVSSEVASALERVGYRDGRVETILSGVDDTRFRPADDRTVEDIDGERVVRVLYVGHLSERKGVGDLLEASRLLIERGVAHRLTLVGGRPDDTESLLAADDVADHVDLVGAVPVEQMPEHYRRADVFCLPSWWEATPLSVLEAMASGLPVVATAVGDIPAMMIDGVTGQLVPVRDASALADVLEKLIADHVARSDMGRAGRRLVEERFALDRSHHEVWQVYQEVLA